MRPQLVIPMTGVSSRFTAAGYRVPKFMLQIDGQTMIEHVIDMYAGWTDVVFACNELHLADESLDLERLLLSKVPTATIVSQPSERRGPAWAVLGCRDAIDPDRPVVVNYCDFTAVWDVDGFAEHLSSGEVAGSIPCYTGFHPHLIHSTSYAYVRRDAGGDVVAIQEKQPWTDDPMGEHASSGTYGFDSGARLIAAIEDQIAHEETLGDEYYLSLTYRSLLRSGARVTSFPVDHFMQWGTPQDLEEYRTYSTAIAGWRRADLPGDRLPQTERLDRVVLAAGAGDRFRRAGYGLPKPALPLSGTTLLDIAIATIPGARTVIVTRDDLPDGERIAAAAAAAHAEVVSLPGLSEGQAASGLAGLRAIDAARSVTIGACDAIATVAPDRLLEALAEVGPDGMVCWTAPDYVQAKRNPSQYGWVVADEGGRVSRSWLKARPDRDDAQVVIGTFSFGSAAGASRAIERMIALDSRINGEFYLDGLIPQLIDDGIPVLALPAASFVSVGTPAEYETVRYWQACFNRWSLHPYKFAADPFVPAAARALLARSSAAPFETVSPWR